MFPSIIRYRLIITAGNALLCALVLVTASFALPQAARAASAARGASGVSVLIPATAQWVNTGISLNNGDQLAITATGSWTPGPTFGTTGPDGFTQPNPDNFLNLQDIGSCASCASTPAPHFAALIGYVGNAPPPPGSYTSTSILPEAQKVFFVGSNFGVSIAVTGTLWLNFNDDAYSNNTSDNAGQVTAAVTDTPSNQPLGGKWISPANGFTVTQGTILHLAAHAFGGAGVSKVNFTIWWPAIGNNPWFVACKVSTPKSGTTDEYDCDWNLKDGNGNAVPSGTIKVGFDVYDNAGQRILSPDGVRSGTIQAIQNNPEKLFVLVQGINTSYSGSGIPQDFVSIVSKLHSKYSNASFSVYSYPSLLSSPNQPLSYQCGDTFTDAIDSDIFALSLQINLAIIAHPHTDVTIIAHSLGGVVAFGYIAALVEGKGVIQTLPVDQNGKPLANIKAIVTLDSPLGGVTNDGTYGTVINSLAVLCNPSGIATMTAVDQLKALFNSANDATRRGKSASIVQAILGGGIVTYPYISNQNVADDAKGKGITVLTVGNTNDGLWMPKSVCSVAQNFPTTQWLTDEGSAVYGRVFTSKAGKCLASSILQTHKAVFNLAATEQAIEQILNNMKPDALKPAPK